jgi:Spy/CpxP family protein refolding chaperone
MKSRMLSASRRLGVLAMIFTLLPLIGWSQNRRPQRPDDRQSMHFRMDQRGPQHGLDRIAEVLELTDEQKEKIEAIRVKGWEEAKPLRNDLNVKQAELRALIQSDSPNTRTINVKIDEIGKLRTELHKKRVAHRLEIRSLLTKEQQMKFDKMSKHRMGKWKRR